MSTFILKFVFVIIPAVLILLHWRRRGIGSPLLYTLSWIDVGSYLLWLLLIGALDRFASDGVWKNDILGILFVFWPMLATIFALGLAISTMGARRGERAFIVSSNLLMIVLWASSIVTFP
jgi:hypothetical protein